MKLQIKEFADSVSGLVLSRREAPAGSQGALEYRLITLASIAANGTLDTKEVGYFYASKPIATAMHLTQPWDVVVRLTPPYTAALVEPSQAGFVVPSNCVLVRIRDGRVAPKFLWYALNSESVRRSWERNASGSVLTTIRPTQIAALELEIPTLEKQVKIVEFVAAAREECSSLRALADEKEKYYAALVEKKLENENDEHNAKLRNCDVFSREKLFEVVKQSFGPLREYHPLHVHELVDALIKEGLITPKRSQERRAEFDKFTEDSNDENDSDNHETDEKIRAERSHEKDDEQQDE